MEPATQAWWFAAGRLLGTVVIGCGVGWLFGNVWGGLACALALHLAWVLVNLFRLEWWLRHRSYADPPDVGGVWGEIIAQIVRLHRRKRFHKQRFVQLMRQLQRSTAALPNGVVILNAQREIVWFNRMAARLLNLRRTADLGMRIEHLMREPEFVRYLGGGDYTNPVIVRTSTGEECYLSMQVAPYGDGQLLLLVSDVSRQMRLEETGEIVGGEPIDIAALMVLLRKDVLARVPHPREVRVRIDSAAQLRGDEPEIHSAFSNLVDNAAKYTPAEGSLEMRWWVDEDGGHFSVSDTGMGIPAEHIPRLAERFYRVDPGRSRSTGGSGLGLAIVKHALQRHGAALEVQSTLGAGSTFTCHFPAERVLMARAPDAATA